MKISIPRVAAIHDLAGFGRAALSVVMPILSTMGIHVCPIPTAILSTHGGFPGCSFVDLTEQLSAFLNHWRTLHLQFDAIYSGFLGSAAQIDIFSAFIEDFRQKDQLIVIDPVLGDYGKIYGVIAPEMVAQMRKYIALADMITPNLTEAAILLQETYNPEIPERELKEWLLRLSEQGPDIVMMTSVPVIESPNRMAVMAYNRRDGHIWRVSCERLPANFPGTGDAFTSVVVGSLLHGESVPAAIERAVQFVSNAIRTTIEQACPVREGVLLEHALPLLNLPIGAYSFEQMA